MKFRHIAFFLMNCFFLPIAAEPSQNDHYLDSMIKKLQGTDTMISNERLMNLWKCMEEVEHNGIPGDFIETGVWRGGATIFMRAFLKAQNDRERKVWVADSFEGFPATIHPDGAQCNNQLFPLIAVSIETVKDNFKLYDLLDSQVIFLKGFFAQTLPSAPIERLAILRLDGDLYESTMDALNSLYPKLSKGGYIIIDDYGHWPGCKKAVDEYRWMHDIHESIIWEDYTGIHWRKDH